MPVASLELINKEGNSYLADKWASLNVGNYIDVSEQQYYNIGSKATLYFIGSPPAW